MRYVFSFLIGALPLASFAAPDFAVSTKIGLGVSWLMVATAFVLGVYVAVLTSKPSLFDLLLGSLALTVLLFSGLGVVGQLIFLALLFGANRLNLRRLRTKGANDAKK